MRDLSSLNQTCKSIRKQSAQRLEDFYPGDDYVSRKDERRWLPNLTGEMDEEDSDSESLDM